jgi:hypothetical protein
LPWPKARKDEVAGRPVTAVVVPERSPEYGEMVA